MNKQRILNKKTYFIALFALMTLVGKNINFSRIIGTKNQFFTVYQLVGPIAGKFLGTTFGVVAVLTAELLNFLIMGKEWSVINILRLTPMLFAAYYFGSKRRFNSALIAAICMVLFNLHPVGRKAWLYSMYWLIPIIARVIPNNVRGRLFLQSFGATFTAHAVGSTLFLYTVPMTSAQWLALIPIVAIERLVFGLGIAGSYIITNITLGLLAEKISIPQSVINLDKNYLLNKSKEAVRIKA